MSPSSGATQYMRTIIDISNMINDHGKSPFDTKAENGKTETMIGGYDEMA